MNSYLLSAIALCVAAQCVAASYNNNHNNGYQQRKLAPTPQQYSAPAPTYGGHEQQAQQYEQAAPQYEAAAPAYRAPSSAAVSQYDERTPAASYNKPAPAAYAPARQAAYAAPAAYAKPAPKYEEPYYPPMPFAWGYDINDGYGGAQYHKENGDEYGKRTGSYGYTDAYGIYRQVDYVADEHGFRATIKTNEPGTANESPADVELHAYEPPSNYYAGNKDSYAAPAPKSYAAPAPQYAAPAPAAYAAPAPAAYHAPRPSGYARAAPAAGYGAQKSYAPRQQHYQEQAQYSSSVLVPKAVAAPAKHY